ncbi:CrcB protein [Thalassobacillus cyri]|uniref:Fluoride-specific ion channel FluC n=1 Tax=Thalassobacillus cyri TaxID=571932 RepID=A0A1H4HFG8_9BACI|nr:fluoride efflux transporter CrcB [Thalassobacillus cyri]SEB20593.1 CrcB protein [Thalassobacillus cyri]
MNIILVAIGGALGAMARYLLGLIIMNRFTDPPIPFAMLTVNILGSFVLGLFFGLFYGAIPGDAYQDSLFLSVGIGFFGAFTTFSTFSVELVQLVKKQYYSKAVIYLSISVLGSITAFVVGLYAGG